MARIGRQPLKANPRRQRTARVAEFPAPTGGWNARDTLSAMPKTDALTLINWIPDNGFVKVRPGYASHATGLTSDVESLMEYSGPAGTNKLFGAAGTNVYEVTSPGAVGAAAIATTTNARWQHTMFATSGGNYLCMVNGAKGYYTYDGSSWTDQSANVTGVTASDLIHINAHQSRLWFIEKNSTSAWYLGTSSIIGAATEFPLGPLCKLGGYLLAMTSWTQDGGDGVNDYAVFITSKGELIIYQGTDPADADKWSLVGVFRVPEPIGRRCFIKAGADVAILTSQGMIPLSKTLAANAAGATSSAFTNKITTAFRSAFASSGTNFGWEAIQYPAGNIVLVNVPMTEGSVQEQFVLNVTTGAWCRFTGINANCWSLLGTGIYFGGNDGVVYRFDNYAVTDNGAAITATCQTSFNQFGSAENKRMTNAKPLFLGPNTFSPTLSVKMDFNTTLDMDAIEVVDDGTLWDVGDWDLTSWGDDQVPITGWQPISGLGQYVSLAFTVSTSARLGYNGTTFMYEKAGLW
jgi:hypothetical protein